VGRIALDLPKRGWRPATLVVYDAAGHEVLWARWYARLQIAWALTGFADVPEDEAEAVERQLVAEWEEAKE
jgi:hypothetical protein